MRQRALGHFGVESRQLAFAETDVGVEHPLGMTYRHAGISDVFGVLGGCAGGRPDEHGTHGSRRALGQRADSRFTARTGTTDLRLPKAPLQRHPGSKGRSLASASASTASVLCTASMVIAFSGGCSASSWLESNCSLAKCPVRARSLWRMTSVEPKKMNHEHAPGSPRKHFPVGRFEC